MAPPGTSDLFFHCNCPVLTGELLTVGYSYEITRIFGPNGKGRNLR